MIPKSLKPIIATLVCIAFIREINNAAPLSVYSILLQLQGFEFDFEETLALIDFFKNGSFSAGFQGWNSNLNGITGFFTNIGNTLTSFFTMISNLVSTFVLGLWNIVTEIFSILGQILDLILTITGFKK